MNELKRENTVSYFADRIAYCKRLAQELTSDDRADEAVFAKVRMNVYDIFQTVFSVAVKTSGQDDQKVIQFFSMKLQQIPRSWHTALMNAQQHGETEKAHIERIKLDTVAEIEKEFLRIWEVST